MTAAAALLAGVVLLPLGLASACLAGAVRARVGWLLATAPLPGLAAAWLLPAGTAIALPAPLRITLALDGPGAMLLGAASLLWCAAGLYASATMGRQPGMAGFAVAWLMTLAGSLGVFVVADLASFYLLFTLASLPAWRLIVHDRSAAAWRAGHLYVVLALAGEAFLLAALVLLAIGHAEPNPPIAAVVAELAGSPAREPILLFLILAFALKMGLLPVHVWLPLAHPAAPMPASAALSGVVVKAGVIGLIRFLPADTPLFGWGGALALLGLATAFYGAGIGTLQKRPKTILAYSTVSQMGLVAAIAGAGLAGGDPAMPDLVAFYGVHHTLVKGALFLGLGVLMASGGGVRWAALAVMAVLALSLAGLPLTSGALAKLAAKPIFGSGLLTLAASLAAAGSTVLMLRFLAVVSRAPLTPGNGATAGRMLPWLAAAAASFIWPWALYPAMFDPEALAKLLWPILLGGGLFLLPVRLKPPSVPEGDILIPLERQARHLGRLVERLAAAEAVLRRWPVGVTLLAGLACILGVLLLLS